MSHTLENALVTGAILIVFVLPVVIIAQHAKRKRKTDLIESIHTTAREHAMQLTRYDYLGCKIIGWAPNQQTVIFNSATDPWPTVIDLSKVGKCYSLTKMNGSDVRSVTLQLVDRENKLLHSLPFYEQFVDNEMQLKKTQTCSKEWEQLINTSLYSWHS